MNDLATIQDYVNKVQELYSETYFERRMNSQGDNENQNETFLMFEQINQDHSIIESLLEMCGFLIGQIHVKQEEQAELNDYQDRIKKQFEEELRNEIEEVQQYKVTKHQTQNLYNSKCQLIDEQLEAIQDLEQQVQILQNQNTILENQAYQQDKQSIDENVTHLLKQQETQIQKAQLQNQELQANNKKFKQEAQDLHQQISGLQNQNKDQQKQIKDLKKEISQIKLIRQQQDGLIASLESDLKIHNEKMNEQETQIDQLKEQLRQIHNQQFLQLEKQEQEKNLQSSSFIPIQFEKNTRSDSLVNQQQHNLKVQLPLLSYRQCLYKYRISEVSERYEQSASHSKHETAVPEKYADVIPFEISNIEDSIKDKRLSFQQDADFSSKYIQQNIPQTARIGLGKQVVPKLSITDINNRITVVKKKKNCEQSNITLDQQDKSILKFKEQSKTNPYQIFFELLVQCSKLNSEFFDEIYNIDTSSYYTECLSEGIPYFKWQEWISVRLTQNLQ